MSNLLVQNIKHTNNTTAATVSSSGGVAVAGTLAVTGVHTVGNNAVYTSDGGAVTQNLVQGLAKSWINFVGTGTISISDSLNFSSINDEDTGQYGLTFTNNMGNADYSIDTHDRNYGGGWSDSNGTTGFDTRRRHENNSYSDASQVWASTHGDLA